MSARDDAVARPDPHPQAGQAAGCAGADGAAPDAAGLQRRRGAQALLGGALALSWPWPAAAAAAVRSAAKPAAAASASAAGSGAGTAPAAADGVAITGRWVHAFAAYGAPKYGPDFQHFDYVDPQAPRAGTLKLRNPDRRSSFDKYNPWTTRGNAPAGVFIWMVEGLAHLAQDEPSTVYGLIAESIYVEPDFSAASFRLRPTARFNNGDPVTPADVVHSHAMFASKGAGPDYQTVVAGIAKVVALDARTVRFEFREKGRDQVFIAACMPVFSRKWGEGKTFDQITTEYPITTGPYLIDKVDMPRRIEFRFNPDYHAKDLPVRRGHFNFERVVYRYYADNAVAREAFKAGEFDLYKEYGARSWARLHMGPKWDDGRIRKMPLTTAFGQGLQSYHLNNRRPIFQDIRVREALTWTYDFETLNKTGIFKRADSVFCNSEFGAQGLPSAGELKLLEPFRAELPPRVFGPAFRAPSTAGNPNGLRHNLLKARALLEEAGWKLDGDGLLRNARGEPFEFEYMTPRDGGLDDWQRNLLKLGIKLKERVVDFALYRRRLEKYDFDMVTIVEGDFTLPRVADLISSYGSKSADEEGNGNYRGIKSRAVDALLDALVKADSLAALRDAARALDRVVMWNFWQVPDLYADTENISVWNRFGIPKVQARYFAADTLITGFNEFAPWPLWCWWDKASDKRLQGAPA